MKGRLTRPVGLLLAGLLLATLLLAGCGQKDAAAESAPEPKTPEETAAPAPAPPEVENNGGCFVRVDDTVYFRRYGADALEVCAIFGEFTSAWNTRGGESELMAYDTASGSLTELYTETGTGALWYGDGGFYLCERINRESYVVWYALDGSGSEPLCAGTPLGITENGLLAVERAEREPDYHTVYVFYRDKNAVGELEAEEGMEFAGLTDDGLFLLETAYSEADETASILWQITPEGRRLRLGELPETEESLFYLDVQADRFLAAGDRVALGVGYYAGTGHFLNESVFVEADVGQEDSLRVLTPDISEGEDGELPRLTVGEDGAIAFAAALPEELRVGWDEMGALAVWEDGGWQLMSEHFAPPLSGGWGYRHIVQEMDYIDGAAYVMLACVHASPADDIGWRAAYRLLDMLYLKVERDGTERELACVDHGAELYGNVWFIEGESVALWQQLNTANNADDYDADYLYAIPIAEDAYWDSGWEGVFDGVTGLLPYDYGEGEVSDYGYPKPDAEPAGALCLELDRDGNIVSLSRKGPAAVLAIDYDVPEEELTGAVETFPLERRISDEDTPWYWVKLRALENGVRVRLERTPEQTEVLEEIAMIEGAFAVGETVYDGVLDRGEYLAVRVSLPWHPEVRVSVGKNGGWGSYVFGEDNYLHLETEESVHSETTLSAFPLPGAHSDFSGEELRQAIGGCWFYCSPSTGEIAALLYLDGEDGSLTVTCGDGTDTYVMDSKLDRLYAEEWDAPDLLCLSAEDSAVTERLGFDGAVGDYLVELFRTDGEEILHLIQANNGDGALSAILPDAEGAWAYDYVLTRSRGMGESGARRRGADFPAQVVRHDAVSGVCWLQEAAFADYAEDGSPILRVNPDAPCLAYPCAGKAALRSLETGRGTEHPMEQYTVSVNADGEITMLQALNRAE